MEKLELVLDENELNSADGIEVLIQAANDVFQSSEQDFNSLKNKKWYSRLWNIVTFSKENSIIVAKNVSSLAKLQEIVMKALLILAKKNTEVAAIVQEHSGMIARVSKNQVSLLKEIEKLKYNFDKELDIKNINENKKFIILNILCKYTMQKSNNGLGKEYVRNILKYSMFTTIDCEIDWEEAENLNQAEMELLFRLVMEYSYIAWDEFEDESELFDYIAISPKRKKAIMTRIQEIELVAGKEFFMDYYIANTETLIIDEEGIDIGNNEIQNTCNHSVRGGAYEALGRTFNVMKDEHREFRNATINILGEIVVLGRLSFHDCCVEIEERINLQGQLEFHNCEIVFKGTPPVEQRAFSFGNDEKECYFIYSKRTYDDDINSIDTGTLLEINNCMLKKAESDTDKEKLIGICKFESKTTLIVRDSVTNNLPRIFSYDGDPSDICIENTNFNNSEGYIIDGRLESVRMDTILIDGFRRENPDSEIISGLFRSNKEYVFRMSAEKMIEINNITMKNINGRCCELEGECVKLSNSTFEDCNSKFDDSFFASSNPIILLRGDAIVEKCKFHNVSQGIQTQDPVVIKESEFNNITDGYAITCSASNSDGETKILDSTFSNSTAAIDFDNYTNACVERCKFTKCFSEEGYISAIVVRICRDEYTVKVSDCKFIECGSENESISCDCSYTYGLFNSKTHEFEAAESINCSFM